MRVEGSPMSTVYRCSRWLLYGFLKLFFRFRIHNMDNLPAPPYIAVGNHASYLDPPILGVVCRNTPICFMAKKELFTKPVIGTWSRAVGCISVDRDANSTSAIKDAIKRLKEGRSVGIFPEGTRSEDGEMQEAKRGAGFIIAKAGVPVVPVYIKGTYEALPKGGKYKFGSKIDAYIGKPISTEEVRVKEGGKPDYGAISDLVMRRVAGLKP